MKDSIISFLRSSWQVKALSQNATNELQGFLNNFEDFFLLCEGEAGNASSLLAACPPQKNVEKDKAVIGIYKENSLIGLLDLIQNYPDNGTWLIGYLLIHPDYRGQSLGSSFIKDLSQALLQQGALILRCAVQEQNPKALSFWQKNGFIITEKINKTLGKSTSVTFILEKALNNTI